MSEKFKRDHHCGTLTKADSGKEGGFVRLGIQTPRPWRTDFY